MVDYEDERTPQEVAERRRDLKIGKAISDAVEIKLDRVRKMDFKSHSIIQMEHAFRKKAWKILADLNIQDWAHGDTINLIWAGLLYEHPDIDPSDVEMMWDATPFNDRMRAFGTLLHILAKAVGAPVDEKAYEDTMALWERMQAATKVETKAKE